MNRHKGLERRTGLTRSGHLRRTGRLPAQSEKRRGLTLARQSLVLRVLSARPLCEARLPGCEGKAVDVHEPKTRARGGSIVEEANTLAVCRRCHEYVHRFPVEATRLGFLVHSWEPS